MTRRQNF